jgi:glutathione peroxidase
MSMTQPASTSATALHTITIRRADGSETTLAEYAGKVLLIVNVASKCGLTPQYDGLQALYASHRDRGLMILGFPANEFLSQEPGTDAEIQQFCRLNYGVEFPVFSKIVVKGAGQHPLYAHLTRAKPVAQSGEGFLNRLKRLLRPKSSHAHDISWNFEKFVISRKGEVVERFAPDIKPDDPRLLAVLTRELAASA